MIHLKVVLHMIVKSGSELAELSDALHDAVFLRDDVRWDAEQGVLELYLWRECEELRSEPVVWFLPFIRRRRFRRARCLLSCSNLIEADVAESDEIGHHSLVAIRHRIVHGLHQLTFESEGAITISCTGNQLEIECADTGEFSDQQFGYLTLGLGGVRKEEQKVSGRSS